MRGVEKGSLVDTDLTLPGEEEWEEVGQVECLYIYPVKSLAPVRVDSFTVENTGPRSGRLVDRQLMVVDGKTGKMITARGYPQMVLIQPRISSSGVITLSYPGHQKERIVNIGFLLLSYTQN